MGLPDIGRIGGSQRKGECVMAERRFMQAINDALTEEMERDPRIILFGEDVKASPSGDARGLQARFGASRVRNTPISEETLTGMAVGAAAAGRRVVLHMMFSNFLYAGFDGIANQMTKLPFMTGGQIDLPLTMLCAYGGGTSTGAHHSDTPYSMLMNLSCLNVVVPATPADAKGLLKSALRRNTPTVYFEARTRGGEMGEVPDGDIVIPFGKARIARPGRDVTIVAIGAMVRLALQAAEALAKDAGIDAEVLDPRTLVPFDEPALLESIAKTGHLVIVDESRDCCSAASHIAALAADNGFRSLRAPVRRVTVPDIPMPYAPTLEKVLRPDATRIAAAVKSVLGLASQASAEVSR
jgi:pyruvate dehydrogenase E1 component beta subunit